MKKCRLAVMALALVLAMTACGKKAETPETGRNIETQAAETTAAETTENAASDAGEATENASVDAGTENAAEAQTDAEPEESELYKAVKNTYENQCIPEGMMLVEAPILYNYVSDAYKSVTIENMQGGWVNKYKEGGDEYTEILYVNGERGKIVTYKNGVIHGVWNDEGYFSIEDRSDRNVCPAVRIDQADGVNICTIYVRWVKDDSFYDGGFLTEWKRIPEEESNYLYDTVTMENLEGVWYSEYYDDGGFYQDVLKIDGENSTLFETINNEPSEFWNKKGKAWLEMEQFMPGKLYPELLLEDEGGNGTAGIYITSVDEYRFYDVAFNRYWIKVPKDIEPYWGMDEDCDCGEGDYDSFYEEEMDD